MRLLLAFGNRARQGKDSACAAIANYFNAQRLRYPRTQVFKFADALYNECRRDHGMTEKNAPLLQRVGQARRDEDPEYWIDKLAYSMKDFKGVGLISDLRHVNEARWIQSQGGFVINVSRLNEDGRPYVAPDRDPSHISETALDDYLWSGYIKTFSGQEGLAAELAITMANYFFQITEPKS